ncbi:MAG: fibro-slime domain-containing protein [Lachnospiraceae bacterium]
MEESAGHTHSDACYQTESTLVCGMEESEEHVHDESCYATSQTLICGQEESAGHTHTDACHDKALSCGKAEHTHTEDCFIDSGADVEDASVWDAQYAGVEWKDAWGEDLAAAAQMQVGYKESTKNYIVAEDGSHKGYTRYGQFVGDAYADWDAPFVNFCLHYAGLEASNMFPNEKVTAQWYDTFVKANEENQKYLTAPAGYEPKPGDIIFFHKEGEETDTQMGIVSSYDKEKNEIKVIEGNSGNEVKENKYDIGDQHISSYMMVTEMEKAYKPSDAGEGSAEENTEAPEDTSQIFTTEENTEETWAYENSYEDDTIVIHVRAGEGVVPEGAELSVTPIEQKEVTSDMTEEEAAEAEKVNEQYELTNQKLQEESEKKQETLEGFLAYDICFIVDGEEVEPSGDVKVTMDFKEATKPEGVSENAVVAVNHLKEDENAADGIVVEDLTAKADTTIATAEADAAVEKVELVAESFSTFVVSWGSNITKIEVKYVDQDGIAFGEPENKQLTLEANKEVILKEVLNPPQYIENGDCEYQKIRAKYNEPGVGTKYLDVEKICYVIDYGEEYLDLYQNSTWDWNIVDFSWHTDVEIQVVYDKKGLTTVETIDSSDRVDIKMIDYSKSTNKDYPWSPFDGDEHDSGVRSGLLSDKLSDDGYPMFRTPGLFDTQNNRSINGNYSLKNLFSGTGLKSANHLFVKNEFDATGDYYYNSAETAAVFDEESGNFTVYNELVVPYYNSNIPGYHSGNFLPYNTISDKQRAQEGLPFYLPDGSEIKWDEFGRYEGGTAANYHFGMEMSADFLQPKDGLRNGTDQPIRYEFDGDDDLWIYIDGVLILDIGGIHPAQSGYIDFSTGEVVVNGAHQYYLKERFEAVLNSSSSTDADKQKFASMEWNGNTFADYTAHTFKMWYMERGAGASDLKVRFNLPAITKNTINVTKRLKDENNNYVFNSTQEFGFKIYYKESGDDEYKVLTDSKSISVPGRTVTVGTGLNQEGVFTLRPEETATVQLPQGAIYYVEEVNLNTSQYNAGEVEIYSTATGRETPIVEGTTVRSEEANVDSRKAVIFTNHEKGAAEPATKVEFEKKWDDFDNIYEARPEEITVALHGEIQKEGIVIDINETDPNWISKNINEYQKTVKAKDKWECKWSGLPIHYTNDEYTDPDGNLINYPISWTVKEVGEIIPYQAETAMEESGPDPSTKYMSITNKLKVDWQMIKCSSTDKSKTLKGAKFDIKNVELPNDTLATGESKDDDGKITWTPATGEDWNTFKESLNGEYIITETQAPEGYVRREVSWKVEFIKGVPKIEGADFDKYSSNNRTVKIYIKNSILYALPDAGGSGIYLYMFSGMLLMAVAVLITYKNKKRRKGVLRS